MLTFGLARSPWQTAKYIEYPSIGRFESESFDPESWKPHAPTAAYMEMLPDDAFWAARRVAAFDDNLIRAIVHTGHYSDAAAEQHLAAVLMQRRDKIATAYLSVANPIVNPALSLAGDLTFDNAAVTARATDASCGYVSDWLEFDNQTGTVRRLGRGRGSGRLMTAPAPLPSRQGAMVEIDVSGDEDAPPSWQHPIQLHFRRAADGWLLVGLDRRIGEAGIVPVVAHREP
jgi:hypothetical protein